MTLFARIQDPNGVTNGLDGWVIEIVEFKDIDELRNNVGEAYINEYVIAPNGFCVGWHYKNNKFTAPE